MPVSELIARLLIPAILVVAVLGVPAALWWERHRPSVPAHVAEMRGWSQLSTAQQAAHDDESIATRAAIEKAEREARARAEDAARLAVERRAEVNVLFHP